MKLKAHYLSLALPVLLGVGCSTTNNVIETTRFKVEKNTTIEEVSDRQSPQEIIAFARNVSNQGRHDRAAQIYLDAASRFTTKDQKFERDCKKSAVREYWLAGKYNKADELLNELEDQDDIYIAAAEQPQLTQLRKLIKVSRQASEGGI